MGIELRQTYQIQITLDKKLSGDVSSFAKWASSGVIFSPSCYAVYNWTASRQAARAAPCVPVGGLASMVAGGVAALRDAVRRTCWRREGSFEVPWKGNKKVPADEGPFPDSSEAVLSLQTTVDSKVIDAKYIADTNNIS